MTTWRQDTDLQAQRLIRAQSVQQSMQLAPIRRQEEKLSPKALGGLLGIIGGLRWTYPYQYCLGQREARRGIP